MPAHAPRVAVVFGADQFGIGAGRAEVIGDLLAQVGGVTGPIDRNLEQQRIAVW